MFGNAETRSLLSSQRMFGGPMLSACLFGKGEFLQKRECLGAEATVCFEDYGDHVVWRVFAFFVALGLLSGVPRGDRRHMIARQG